MGLKTMSLVENASSITVGGGQSLSFSDDGVTIPNGVHLIVPADADYATRRQVTVKFRPPTLDAKTGSYSKDKKSICIAVPIYLADGRIVFNTLRIEREVHPQFEVAKASDLNSLGAQMLSQSDCDNFWAAGSLS